MFSKKLKIMTLGLAFAVCVTSTPNFSFITKNDTVYAAESSVESATIEEILENQNSDGGWKKNYSTTSGEWSKSTIDNGATYTEIRLLAEEYADTKDSVYSEAAIKGINFLLKMQYDNGGWPQVYNGSGYHAAITFNDNAMISVMKLLDDVANKKGDFSFVSSSLASKCKTAVDKGIQCLLNCQVVTNGKLTVWGQQHDKDTLKPTSARAYEVASLCAGESANIINFLNTREKTAEINAAIKAGVNWFKETVITGIKVVKTSDDTVVQQDSSSTKKYWARFYEIGTNKPIFVGRDGIVKYQLCDIEQERRTGYSWYGTWGTSIIKITVDDTVVSPSPSPSVSPSPSPSTSPSPSPSASTTPSTSLTKVQNFTTSGKTSDFYTISGNLSTSKGTVTYNGLTLTTCLKIESSTNISFHADKAGKLTLVFNDGCSKKIKIDGTAYTISDGILEVDLSAGSHTITKKDSINLYYMSYSC